MARTVSYPCVIASAIGGLTELIAHQEDGYLVPPDAPDVLAAQISSLLHNRDELVRIGKNASAKVERQFSVEKWMMLHNEVYSSVLQNAAW